MMLKYSKSGLPETLFVCNLYCIMWKYRLIIQGKSKVVTAAAED